MTPASGVRSAPEEPGKARHTFDSDASLTQIGLPDPTLLALARGEPIEEEKPSTEPSPTAHGILKRGLSMGFLWFLVGLGVGGLSVWASTSDVSADVYRVRLWVASTLRSTRMHAVDDIPAPSETVTEMPSLIPTVDVTQLPKAREEQVQAPSAAPAPAPTAPGAPALQHAPGPR